ncbi:MAG: Dyp-type peroxidase [Thiobacillus sp.]|nr:Dyp-type peroxidase [Thiobacillus sp.]
MTAPVALFEPIPDHARHLFFDLAPGGDVRTALAALAARCDGQAAVLGIGAPVAHALNTPIPGLRPFPELPQARPPIPATQHALWLWLRGDEPGNLLLRGHRLEALAAPAFVLKQAIVSFRHQDYRDLTGFEDGTENPEGEAATEAALGFGGSSFAAVQQWLHDFTAFDAMTPAEQNACVGRDRASNEELDDAPASAHVKRTAQEDFEPEAFVVRRSMPWVAGEDAGLVFLAFGKSFDAFEAQLKRMTGHDDGISDALFRFSRPLTGGYYWCPPVRDGATDLGALG